MELKLRGLPVSGTKTDLIERLKPFQDSSSPTVISVPVAPTPSTISVPMEITSTTSTPALVFPVQQVASESQNPTPPVSPVPADPSSVQQDVSISDPPQVVNPGGMIQQSWPITPSQVPEEKDRRLHEKERQIEELMRKLEQEQKLVEALKMQLEVEKRASDSVSPKLSPVPAISTVPAVLNTNILKMEAAAVSNSSPSPASLPNPILGSQALSSMPTVVKLEDVTVSCGKPLQLQSQAQLITQIQPQASASPQLCPQAQRSPKLQTKAQPPAPSVQQFFISHAGGVPQVLSQPQTLLTTSGPPQTLLTTSGQAATQILLPVSLPNSATALQLPSTTVSLQVRPGELQGCYLRLGPFPLLSFFLTSSPSISACSSSLRVQSSPPPPGPSPPASDH